MRDQENKNTCGRIDTSFTWKHRLRLKLFPPNYPDCPRAPENYKDVLHQNSVVELSFLDRIRILISGRIAIKSQTVTENLIGKCTGKVTVFVLPPEWADSRDLRHAEKVISIL